MIKEHPTYIKYYKEVSTITDLSILIEYTNIVVERFQVSYAWPNENLRIENACYLAAILKRLGEVKIGRAHV